MSLKSIHRNPAVMVKECPLRNLVVGYWNLIGEEPQEAVGGVMEEEPVNIAESIAQELEFECPPKLARVCKAVMDDIEGEDTDWETIQGDADLLLPALTNISFSGAPDFAGLSITDCLLLYLFLSHPGESVSLCLEVSDIPVP